jgi:hypothetical protein
MTQSEQSGVLADYVAGLRSLSAEVSAATQALSRNDISEFEARLEAQQSISRRLNGVVLPPEQPASEENVACTPEQLEISALWEELHRAQVELGYNNRIFAGLVKRSALTVSWLSLLCQSCSERYGKDRYTPTASSVSCEV